MRMEFITDRARDLRYALRTLRRAPGFSAVAVATLALGIGANTAVFSLFYGVLLEPLPVAEPDRLVNLASPGPRSGPTSCGSIGKCDFVFSYPMFRDLESIQTVFTGIAAHRDVDVNVAYRGQTRAAQGLLVSGSYFPVLGLRPALGRLLAPHDAGTVGEAAVVVLRYAHWRTELGGRADVLGDTMVINGQHMTIVGVAPEGFDGTTIGHKPDVFIPITMRWRLAPDPRSPPENRRAYWVYLFARLRPGVRIEQAQTAVDARYRAIINDIESPLQEGMSEQMMARFRARGLYLEPGSRGQSDLLSDARTPLTLLLSVTGLVLLVASVNVANLMLARATARSREIATRLAIGASRGRLVAQFVTESSVLAVFAATASLLVAMWTLDIIRNTLPEGGADLPLQLGTSALVATGVLAVVASVAVGVFPALVAVRPAVLPALRGLAGQPGGDRRSARSRTSLATAQVALSVILVVLAGLFTKSLANLTRVDAGFSTDNLVTFSLSPQRNGYTPGRSAALFQRLDEEMAALPGVIAVTSSTTPLLSGDVRMTDVSVEGFGAGPDADRDARYDEIGHGYFRTLGVPLISGREFMPADSESAPRVAIVNERFANKFGLVREAVGKRMAIGTSALDVEIVGLVRDFKHSNLRDAAPPMYFVPHRQGTRRPGIMFFYIRASSNVSGVVSAIQRAVRRLDPHLPIEGLRTMDDTVRAATTAERLMSVMTGGFALLATLVAAIGLYGMFAYAVTQRTPELGVRLALGATPDRVRWMVLRQVGAIAVAGGTIGLGLAVLLGRTGQTLLFGLDSHDTGVLASSIIVLVLVAFAAGLVPANRAARVDPIRALKHE